MSIMVATRRVCRFMLSVRGLIRLCTLFDVCTPELTISLLMLMSVDPLSPDRRTFPQEV